MIKVDGKAKDRLIALRKEGGKDDEFFARVAVLAGGCSGLIYNLDFDNEMKDDDEVFGDEDMKIVVSKKSMLYLFNTTLEFSDGINGKGFVFNNPNAQRTCGCGESFAV